MTAARGLESRLVTSGALRREAVQMARRRQKVYGGGLDTVLLEMGLVDEGTLWALLVEESGLPPLPPALLDGPLTDAELLLSAAEARRLGAFLFRPAASEDGPTQAVARPGYDAEAIQSVLRETPAAEVFIVPEVRFEALMGGFYRQPIPPRFLSLLGRLMGAEQVRRWAAARAPRPAVAKPIVDVGPRFATPQLRELPGALAKSPGPLPDFLGPLPDQPPAPQPEAPAERFSLEPEAPAPPTTAAPEDLVSPPEPPELATTAPGDHVGLEVDAAIDRIAQLAEAPATQRPGADELVRSLELLAELEGGPRAPAMADAIVSRWSCAEIFSRLPQVAKRGEHAARAVLPLLTAHASDVPLLMQWLQAENPRERAWAALALQPFVSAAAAGSPCTAEKRQLADAVRVALCERIEHDPAAEVRLAMATALRPAVRHKDVRALVQRLAAVLVDSSALDPARADAAAQIGQLRVDYAEGLEALVTGISAKSPQVSQTCLGLLVRITGHDAGKRRAAWQRWWQANQNKSRAAWLVEGLGDRQPDVRLAAARELWELTGQTLGYHFDLPAGGRKAAIVRWKHWLEGQTEVAARA